MSENNLQFKKKTERKKQHSLVFHDDTWQLVVEAAEAQGVSKSEYIDVVLCHYLKNNKTEE